MRIGLIGLGRMGGALAKNMIEHGHKVVAYNRDPKKIKKAARSGIIPSFSVEEFTKKLGKQKIIWLMITAGKPVDIVIKSLIPHLKKGDILIDGGNSFYKDTIKRSNSLKKKGITLLDIGTSGGISGARNGANMMIGGPEKSYNKIRPLIKDVCLKDGYGYFGKSGSGHFVKMIHNGIEYGMMQSIGEGMEIIQKSNFKINNELLTKVWSNGSVIRSWLIELLNDAYKEDKNLKKYSGVVGLSGEGEWTAKTAKSLKVPVPIIQGSVDARLKSKKSKRYQGKVVQALRFGFGGHKQPK